MSSGVNSAVIHRERQPIVWWAWAIVGGIAVETVVTALALAPAVRDGSKASSELIVCAAAALLLGLISLLLTGNRVLVLPDRVELWFAKWPKPVRIPLQTIQACRPVSYSPIRKFGGWGVRGSFSGIRAYTARGRLGLLLYLDNDRRTLIGSDAPECLGQALASVGVTQLPFSDDIEAPMG